MRAIMIKELRSYLRGSRPFTLLTIYLLLLGALLLLTYVAQVSESFINRSQIGLSLYITVLGLALLQLTFLTPAMNASSLGSERDRQTIELLMITPVSPFKLVIGKLIAPCLFLLLLSIATLPLAGIAFLVGGIEIRDLLVGFLLLTLTTLGYGSVGIWAAAGARSSRSGTLLSQGLVFMLAMGLPALAVIVIVVLESQSRQSELARWLLTSPLVRWPAVALMSLSPFVSLVSWIMAIESGDSLWTQRMPTDLGGGHIPVMWLTSLIVWLVIIPLLLWRSSRILPRSVARSGGG